jgi:hypothetical protein
LNAPCGAQISLPSYLRLLLHATDSARFVLQPWRDFLW